LIVYLLLFEFYLKRNNIPHEENQVKYRWMKIDICLFVIPHGVMHVHE